VDGLHKRVTEILMKRREPMEKVSRELIRKETLDRAELDKLLAVPDANHEPLPEVEHV